MKDNKFEVLLKVELFILDMDGTIYLGDRLFEGSREFVELLKENRKEFLFLTNNSSKSSDEYLKKLSKMGIDIAKENLLTSGQATAIYLNGIAKKTIRAYVVGTVSLKKELESFGINIAEDIEKEEVDYLIVGFDTELTYKKLLDACELIRKGIPFLATNPDLVCPLDGGKYIPDCGSICIMLENATKKKPLFIGKPSSIIVDVISKLKNVEKSRIAMIGDRLYTDIKMANDNGMVSILVLSGETAFEDIEKSRLKPTFVYNSIRDIYEDLKTVYRGAG
ncbi:HAD-IIA family hydrolase [Caldicellulosiruptor morganii]|uniref:Acid sugar phosphatase n=1 Tax=Caldicellulosiruptor morganii TaxID=1387555 RepID=A0ABY7BS61_9FIRM|nr:HAD-IIA family hydrolase [Caldicellulosiruptor morganii]WAM34006.1 HAD-IIA family hydrolase [Caldicellulosiruptor morganii]